MLAQTMTSSTVAHDECEALPEHIMGMRSPPPISTGGRSGPVSASHSQRHSEATASTPNAAASGSSLKVSSRKKPAVPSAASSGDQPGPGSAST
ncbi:hypothetical protein D3C72_1950410 [compost metagenome]